MPPLSRDAIFTVLSGLSLLSCDKSTQASAEPPSAAASAPAASAAPAAATPAIDAKEVPSAAGKADDKEKSCAPGGCAAGQCGGKKK